MSEFVSFSNKTLSVAYNIILFYYLEDFLLSPRKCFKAPAPTVEVELELSWESVTTEVTETRPTTAVSRENNILGVPCPG